MQIIKEIGILFAFGAIGGLIFVMFATLPMEASAAMTTIYVDDVAGSGEGNPAEDYTSIQSAINAASTGDTIYIYAGTYNEKVKITKSLILEGEDKDTTLIKGTGSGNGIYSYGISGITIKNVKVQGFYYGIYLYSSGYSALIGNVISGNSYGIYLYSSASSEVSGNTVVGNSYYGIYLMSSGSSEVSGNTVTGSSYYGIDLVVSASCTVFGNTVVGNGNQIYVYSSDYCTLSDNTATGAGKYGIYLSRSTACVLEDNVIAENTYDFGIDGISQAHYIHDIDTSNTVCGKTIYYMQGISEIEISPDTGYSDAGFVGIIGSDHVTIEDLTFTNNYQGVLIVDTEDSTVRNVDVSDTYYGIQLYNSISCELITNTAANNYIGMYLVSSDACSFANNTVSENTYGLYLSHSMYCTLTDNLAENNGQGIFLMNSGSSDVTSNTAIGCTNYGIHVNLSPNTLVKNNTVKNSIGLGINVMDRAHYCEVIGNTVTDNKYGLSVSYSSSVIVSSNTVKDNLNYGITLGNSDSCTLIGNVVSSNNEGIIISNSLSNTLKENAIADNKYNFGVNGNILSNYYQDIDTSNTVDERPIYYLEGLSDIVISPDSEYCDAGYLGILDSDHVSIADLTFSGNLQGILIINSPYTVIRNVEVAENQNGIHMKSSGHSSVTDSTVTFSKNYGITMISCEYSEIIGNTITDNSYGIYLASSPWSKMVVNSIEDNGMYGIYMYSSSTSEVTGNTVSGNKFGVCIYYSSYCTVSRNKIADNDYCMYLYYYGNSNTIYHNDFIGNTVQVYSNYVTNTWDDGYPSGGNFWSDYSGNDEKSGPDQDQTGSDGLGDTPYVIALNNNDEYPLISPWGPEDSIAELMDEIEAMELSNGLENSLVSKLENVTESIEEGSHIAAVNQLEAFINQVEAQEGKKLSSEQVDRLIESAEIIIHMITTW